MTSNDPTRPQGSTVNTATASSSFESEHITRYHLQLFAFISLAMLFEGYNATVMSFALPELAKEFHADSQSLGFAISLISLGTVVAFVPVQLADRCGRRPILLVAVLCYSLFGCATSYSRSIYNLICFQFIARLFMTTEVSVGTLVISEESPARYRGRAVTLALGAALAGPVIVAAIFPIAIKSRMGWRLLFLLAGVMIPVLAFYWPRVHETQRWLLQAPKHRAGSLLLEFRDSVTKLFQKQYRRRFVAGTMIWFLTNFWTASFYFFFLSMLLGNAIGPPTR